MHPLPRTLMTTLLVGVLLGCAVPADDARPAPDHRTSAAPDESSMPDDDRASGPNDVPAGPVVASGEVVAVVDGDTIDLADGTRVRLALVDTPEVAAGLERCGREATAFTTDVALGVTVDVVRPATGPPRDDFDRLLGEVVLPDGRSLNVALVAAGLAEVVEAFAEEDPGLARRLRTAAATAAVPDCEDVAVASPPADQRHTGHTDGGWPCQPEYQECLPAGPDLDCAEVGHQVVLLGLEDPWRLDGNSTTATDGVGCDTFPPFDPAATYPYEG